MAKQIRLIDACFPGNKSGVCSEDNAHRTPSHFHWCREKCDSLYTWFTNWTLRDVRVHGYPARVAWLLEPPSIQRWPYNWIRVNRNLFDAVFTYDKRLLESGDNRFKFCPHGGSRIDFDLWGLYPKSRDVCMILSEKDETDNQKLRHKIAERFGDEIDVYQRFDRKFNVLRDYRYCVVVESITMDYYFSEKLIDCFSVGTIPIYYGCPDVGKWFFEGGIVQFENILQLRDALNLASNDLHYRDCEVEILRNLGAAEGFRMPEDRMYEQWPEYFK